jgi:hypothetical protein
MRAVAGGGGLVTPPSPRSLSADSNRPRQRRRRSSSSRARGRGRSSSRERGGGEGEGIDRGAESECSTTSSMHPSLGRPYTPSLPDDSSDADADADADSLRKDSTDSDPSSLSSKDTGGVGDGGGGEVHQLETPESSVHRAPVTSLSWIDSPVADSLASSIVVKEDESVVAGGKPPSYDVSSLFLLFAF